MEVQKTKISNANTTTVPKGIRNALKLEAGDYVEWHIETWITGAEHGQQKQVVIVRRAP